MNATTAPTAPAATYAKLRDGSWGVRVSDVSEIVAGQITVTRRDGQARTETLGRCLWSGEGAGLYAIARASAPVASRTVTRQRRHRAAGDDGCHTGGNCSSVCSPSSCPCGDGGWFRCC